MGGENIEIIDKDDIKHIVKVLRLKAGDKIEVSDSTEFEYIVELVSIPESVGDDSIVVGRIIDKQAFRGEATTRVTLFQCLPKQGKMETIIQKSVELGVYKIVPVYCSRTVVKDKESRGKIQRWNRVAAEAVKQCKRGIIPQVADPVKLEEMTEMFGHFDLVLFPYEDEKGTSMKDVLRQWLALTAVASAGSGTGGDRLKRGPEARPETGPEIGLVIGPEGGFSAGEAALITEKGGKALSLGKTILRTETAGPAALAMIMYELEQ